MVDVIDLAQAKQDREPALTGMAKCQACAHTWAAVAPVGTHELECPDCGATKGYFCHAVVRGSAVFVCDCGCDVFRISREHGPYCVHCAAPAVGWF